MISLEQIRPYSKGPPRPLTNGKKRIKSCIIIEDSEAIKNLHETQMRREKKTAACKKSVGTRPKSKLSRKTPPPAYDSNSSEESDGVQMQLNDSSEYSDENCKDEAPHKESTSIFEDKTPEPGDFILVELKVEEGKMKGTPLTYVIRV